MRVFILISLLALVLVECSHTFLGTNVARPLVFHYNAEYNARVFQKRIEYLNFTLPVLPNSYPRVIQGIMAYDVKNGGASANVTGGGIGTNFVKLRMKSDRGSNMHYDIYIYA